MPASADELQKVFKTLSDPTRIRILRLLENEQLVVQELMEVLGMAQSRVSRHLAILREAGLVSDRRDRTFVSYRMSPPTDPWWRDAWKLVRENLKGDSTAERDDAAMARVVAARGETSRGFFDIVGPEWDALRKVFNDDLVRAHAINRLIDPNQKVADIGTGTGILAIELARQGIQVIGIDGSNRMLDAARKNLAADDRVAEGLVEFRTGDAHALPLEDGEVDAAFAHMVLQYLARPEEALIEMCRIVRPGGSIVVVDFVQHELEWMRDELGVQALGFEVKKIRRWIDEAEMVDIRIHVEAPAAKGRDLPSTFIATARRSAE
ncbi:MAG: metalloregulator ArsR/SmtB family transcription factor [Myxococcales bacterium]|nr:metalloregulator ArsR/SmtB family transcription factor [Myxococcales bacterium]